ncbi:MAG TPA: AsnC family transcriptional regulator [Trebonia sp.]|nr:AsnC family transcriptional regulator [Trebonia sp.]
MESYQPDAVDKQLVHALVTAPRASFKQLADVLGVSDQTISRRYRRLAATMGLRVSGVINGGRLGWVDWYVRLQVTPGSADALADALARRPDTRWVNLASGGTEVSSILQARTDEQRNDLFLRGLPGSRRVTQMTAQAVLRTFTRVEWHGLTRSTLTGEQVTALRAIASVSPGTGPQYPVSSDPVTLRPGDDVLLAELTGDGRAANAALAATLHWHESTVRRRIEELQQQEVLYFDVDVNSELFLGVGLVAMLWLAVEPAHLEHAGRALAGHPEIPFAAATTGPTNLAASAVFRDTRHMYEYLTTSLGGLPGIRAVETAPIIGRVKQTAAGAFPGRL